VPRYALAQRLARQGARSGDAARQRQDQFKGKDSFVFRVVRGIDAPTPKIENITMLVDVD
jgi:hypothetical protein